MDWLAANRPDLIPLYERLYARGAYAPKAERERVAALIRPKRPPRGPRIRGVQRAPEPLERSEPEPRQTTLF